MIVERYNQLFQYFLYFRQLCRFSNTTTALSGTALTCASIVTTYRTLIRRPYVFKNSVSKRVLDFPDAVGCCSPITDSTFVYTATLERRNVTLLYNYSPSWFNNTLNLEAIDLTNKYRRLVLGTNIA